MTKKKDKLRTTKNFILETLLTFLLDWIMLEKMVETLSLIECVID